MKNRNLSKTKKLNNNPYCLYSFHIHIHCTQKKWSKSLIFASNITRSEMKKVDTFTTPMTFLVLCFLWVWLWTVYKQVS